MSAARRRSAGLVLLAATAAAWATACAAPGATPASGRAAESFASSGRRGDVIVIGDYSEVTAVAVGARTVFVASRSGIAMFDRLFSQWLPPLPLGGLPDRSVLLSADPAANAVWIGGSGEVLHYDAALDRSARAYVPGTVDAILFDRRDPASGAYVHGTGGWHRVTPTGFATPLHGGEALPPAEARIVAPSLAQLYREHPMLRAFGALLVRDPSLRPAPVTAGARAPDRVEVWLGTYGNGVFRVDPTFNQATPVPFGLRGGRAAAVALAADGVWVASDGSPFAGGAALTFASTDVQSWRWLGADAVRELRGASVRDVAVRERAVWLATSRGVARMTLPGGTGARLWSAMHGLPADEALAVEATADGAWVGTTRGLAFVRADSAARVPRTGDLSEPALANVAVYALRRTGATLWVGSDAGLFMVRPGSDADRMRPRAERPALPDEEPRLRHPVVALASADSLLFAATADALVALQPRSGTTRLLAGAGQLARLGAVTALAADGRAVWITGRRGALVLDRSTGAVRSVRGLPAPGAVVRDVVLDGRHAWLATNDGLVRLRLAFDGSAP